MIKAVLFDFNGTLFLDTEINRGIWREILNELSKNRIDFDNFFRNYKSVHNHIIIGEVIKMFPDLKNEDIDYWVNKKEIIYRKYCKDNKVNQLTPGAEKLLDYLKENKVKIGLCTSSIIDNVNFYYENVKLDRWFSMDYTVYDNGTYDSKTQMYLDCAKRLNVNIDEVLIIEDSPRSIKEAIKACCKKIVAIKNIDSEELDLPEIKQTINDFTELDYTILD